MELKDVQKILSFKAEGGLSNYIFSKVDIDYYEEGGRKKEEVIEKNFYSGIRS